MQKSFREMFFEVLVVAVVVGILYVPIWLFSYVDGWEHLGGVIDLVVVIMAFCWLDSKLSSRHENDGVNYLLRLSIPVVVIWIITKNVFDGILLGGPIGMIWMIFFYFIKQDYDYDDEDEDEDDDDYDDEDEDEDDDDYDDEDEDEDDDEDDDDYDDEEYCRPEYRDSVKKSQKRQKKHNSIQAQQKQRRKRRKNQRLRRNRKNRHK